MAVINSALSLADLQAQLDAAKARDNLINDIANRLGLRAVDVAELLQQFATPAEATQALERQLAPQHTPEGDWLAKAVAETVSLDQKVSHETEASIKVLLHSLLEAGAPNNTNNIQNATPAGAVLLLALPSPTRDLLLAIATLHNVLPGYAVQNTFQSNDNQTTQAALLRNTEGHELGVVVTTAEPTASPRPKTAFLAKTPEHTVAYSPATQSYIRLDDFFQTLSIAEILQQLVSSTAKTQQFFASLTQTGHQSLEESLALAFFPNLTALQQNWGPSPAMVH